MSKISFKLDPLFLILAFGIGWLNSPSLEGVVMWAIVIFVSILIHELGHALTAISFGQTVQVTFMPLGGLTSRSGPKLSSLKEFLIVLNGPLAGFALYFLCSFFLQGLDQKAPLGYMLLIGTYINLIWTILNLFPVFPLDGGKLMMILLEKIFGGKGGRFAYVISIAFAAVCSIFFFLSHELFAGSIFALFAFESYRGFQMGKYAAPIDSDEEVKKELEVGIKFYSEGHLDNASIQLQEVRKKTGKGVLYLLATYYLAKTLEEQGSLEEAYIILKNEESKLDVEMLETLQRLAFLTKRYQEASKVGGEVFQEQPSVDVAYINALSLAQLKDPIPSVGWFETAMREGLENPLLSSRHIAFDPIRDSAPFKSLFERIKHV